MLLKLNEFQEYICIFRSNLCLNMIYTHNFLQTRSDECLSQIVYGYYLK